MPLAVVVMLGVVPTRASAGSASGWTITLDSWGYDSAEDQTSFTYVLVAPPGREGDDLTVSHLLIDTCRGETAVAVQPPADEYRGANNPDPPTGMTGYKWESPRPAAGDTFTLVFQGNVPFDPAGGLWTVKKGAPEGQPSFVTGTTGGPSCVQPVGSLKVVKDVVGGADPQDFTFSVSDVEPSFVLDDDETSDVPASMTIVGLEPGTYTVTETEVEGWTLTSVDGGTLTGAGAKSATVEVTEGEESVVTFHNTPPTPPIVVGSVRITKDVVGATAAAIPGYTFTFEIDASVDAFDRTVAKGNPLKVTGEGSVTIAGIPVGTTLSVSEVTVTETGATWKAVVDKPTVTVVEGINDVTITNTRTAVGGEGSLPLTGTDVAAATALALVLIVLGMVALVHRRVNMQPGS